MTAAGLFDIQKGPVIGIFHEYAHLGKGGSIYGPGQIDMFYQKQGYVLEVLLLSILEMISICDSVMTSA